MGNEWPGDAVSAMPNLTQRFFASLRMTERVPLRMTSGRSHRFIEIATSSFTSEGLLAMTGETFFKGGRFSLFLTGYIVAQVFRNGEGIMTQVKERSGSEVSVQEILSLVSQNFLTKRWALGQH